MLIPRSLLLPTILLLASVGAYTLNQSVTDLLLLVVVGAAGFVMRVFNVPLVPAVMGFIMGPVAEQELQRTLAISQGEISIFLTRPISVVLLISSVLVVVGPSMLRRMPRPSVST